MAIRRDLGVRVELVPIDPNFHDVTIGLYRRDTADGPVGVVHSYSSKAEIDDRLRYIAHAMCVLGGLERVAGEDSVVRLPCGSWHNAALKRLFLDCFRVDPASDPEPKPLQGPDTRSDQLIRVEPLGGGRYRIHATNVGDGEESRAPVIARALVRLAELDVVDDTTLAFSCGHDHDALVGVMLVRAQNLRSALREEELAASRGVLTAPGKQE